MSGVSTLLKAWFHQVSASPQENVTLITEINELRKELHSLRSTVKPQRGTVKTSKHPKSANVH